MDVHTRKLRCFLVVAEELHFSRAAARVFLTQQALSRQIRELEEELGVALFERTTRRVALTPAGEAFREATAQLLTGLDDAVEAARRTDRAMSGRLRIGFCPGAALELTTPILGDFRSAFPDVELDLREFPANDPSAGLATGVSDVAFIRLPQGTAAIETEDLFIDPCIAAVSAGHPLADRTTVTVADLLDEPLTLSDTADEVYKAFWSLRDARTSPPPKLHPVSSVTEEVALVATGMAISVTSSAVQSFTPMPGVRYLPIEDWPGSRVALGWHAGERSRIVAHFVDTVCAVRDRETELVQTLERRGLPEA
ncbi:LysR family transcriptional regulator [Nocardioides jejuensis]|uniref:LysR family transcriptional regulator n=1 Tax=Nocardioides jejuensis TaxID=2502782 RepID=A0A4R1CIH6_9ACTN|nr:LysR family transcriptional regulator [Nocardioides jejuensis]TCJ31039.1 LysR family transcriptional regulator [Nocardioides jejuensis]